MKKLIKAYPDKDEQTWVFRNSKNKGDLVVELTQEGYNIEYGNNE